MAEVFLAISVVIKLALTQLLYDAFIETLHLWIPYKIGISESLNFVFIYNCWDLSLLLWSL